MIVSVMMAESNAGSTSTGDEPPVVPKRSLGPPYYDESHKRLG